jgi:hypothetical protein
MKVSVQEFNQAVVAALRRLKRRIEELEARVKALEARPQADPAPPERDGTFGPQISRSGTLSESHARAVHRMRKLAGKDVAGLDEEDPSEDFVPLPEPLELKPREPGEPAPAEPVNLEDALDVELE